MPFRIRLSEPANHRYIYVNPITNTVHLMVPLSVGFGIAVDNTCKTVLAMQEFFGKKSNSSIKKDSAKDSLISYKNFLESDIQVLDEGDPLKRLKEDRLFQVNAYIEKLIIIEADASFNCLSGGHPVFPESIKALMVPQSNLHSIVLRPSIQDRVLRTPAPLFFLDRDRPNGTYYHANRQIFESLVASKAVGSAAGGVSSTPDNIEEKKVQLIDAVAKSLAAKVSLPMTLRKLLENGAEELRKNHNSMFHNDIDYTLTPPLCVFVKLSSPEKITSQALKLKLNGRSAYVSYNDGLHFVEAPLYQFGKPITTAAIATQVTTKFSKPADELVVLSADALKIITDLTNHKIPEYALTLGIFDSSSMDDPEIKDMDELKSELSTLVELRVSNDVNTAFASKPSPFLRVSNPINVEKLNILTQFYIAHLNSFAYEAKKTKANFGLILDKNPKLALALAETVARAIKLNQSVEQAICDFIHSKSKDFELSQSLSSSEIDMLNQQVHSNFELAKDSPHMDEFIILNPELNGRFFCHQGSMCFDFADLSTTNLSFKTSFGFAKRPFDEILNMPTILANDVKAPQTGFFVMSDEAFHRQLSLAIKDNNIPTLKRFLLSTLEDGVCVFERLGREYFKQQKSPGVDLLFTDVRRAITDGDISRRFNRVVRGMGVQLLLTPEMVEQLYVGTINTRKINEKTQLLSHSNTADIVEMLAILGITSAHSTVTQGDNGTFVIDTSDENVLRLEGLMAQHVNQLHLTRSMSISLYKQVEANFGIQSAEAIKMNRLNNQSAVPHKLIFAMTLLGLDPTPLKITYPTANDVNGFIIKNLPPADLQMIQNIHDVQANQMQLTRDQAGKLYAKVNEINPELVDTMRGLQNITRPDRIEAALVALGINYTRVEFNNIDGYFIYLPEQEQQKIRSITHNNLIDGRIYQPEPQNRFSRKATRGRLLSEIIERARYNPQPSASVELGANENTSASADAPAVVAGRSSRFSRGARVPNESASVSSEAPSRIMQPAVQAPTSVADQSSSPFRRGAIVSNESASVSSEAPSRIMQPIVQAPTSVADQSSSPFRRGAIASHESASVSSEAPTRIMQPIVQAPTSVADQSSSPFRRGAIASHESASVSSEAPSISREADSLKHVIQGAVSGQIIKIPGSWLAIAPDLSIGIGNYSKNPGLASSAYQIDLKDGKLIILDKRARFQTISDPELKQRIFADFISRVPPGMFPVPVDSRPIQREVAQTPASSQPASSASAERQITVCKVRAFDSSPVIDSGINRQQVRLNCPDHILQAFKDILRGSAILGSTFSNPYTNQQEQFPANAEDLTSRHLQIMARNEKLNVTGVMITNLYAGLLTDNQIAAIRCLVKSTTIAGIAFANASGGFPAGKPILNFDSPQKMIVVDQSGFQWQGDLRNTGGLFFYPESSANLPPHYREWQNEMHEKMYGITRPNPQEIAATSLPVVWNNVKGLIDFDGIAFGIEKEFSQALYAVVEQGQFLEAEEQINFKFLKAGMGFFASGIASTQEIITQLNNARLKGILNALKNIQRLSPEEQRATLGKVKRIELPFSQEPSYQEKLDEIGRVINQLGITWGKAPAEDVYTPRAGYVNAVTNAADPHAMIGNEGAYHSVDAAMATNADLRHLNPGFNLSMTLRVSPSIQILTSPVSGLASSGSPASSAVPSQAAFFAPVSSSTNEIIIPLLNKLTLFYQGKGNSVDLLAKLAAIDAIVRKHKSMVPEQQVQVLQLIRDVCAKRPGFESESEKLFERLPELRGLIARTTAPAPEPLDQDLFDALLQSLAPSDRKSGPSSKR